MAANAWANNASLRRFSPVMPAAPATAVGDAGQSPRPRERLSAAQRLRHAADFDEIRRMGRKAEAGPFTLRLRPRTEGPRRLGVIASRKAGPAVMRNRAKRVLRELFRRNPDILPPSCDVVIVIRANFPDFSFAEIRERYFQAIRQTGKTK
ncbi:MAG TPA: ribonuclease P protein component [Opitutales bacterium]|jgi:ribonuclease P protein component|nr:ribonuclease P protein component [Opitutales bacterium]